MDTAVTIVPYAPDWPRRFAAEAARIRGVLAGPSVRIEHIGSTSVPGLDAKPIIDLAIALPVSQPPPAAIGPLVSLGYRHRGEYGLPGREFFTLGEPATFHVHVVAENSPHWRAWRDFRDALRGDAGLRERYAALKRELAIRHAGNRPAYTAAKTEFIQAVIAGARRGL
jgi:GrpB-like predicted nucleotidyltransferase (UPF0157 family)